jgi:hypothetical protein
MGDFNQFAWVKNNIEILKGPVIEIGSRFYDQKTSMDYRSLFKKDMYLGVDMQAGTNVDKVVDFTQNFTEIENLIGGKYNTVICCSVMEHVKDIFSFAANVSKILNAGGVLMISVPFTWEYHGYPDDYWRFTPSAIKYLFQDFDFTKHENSVSSNVDGHVSELVNEADLNNFITRQKIMEKFEPTGIAPLRWISKAMRLMSEKEFRKEFIIKKTLDHKEYRLTLSCINMIGVKK